MCSSGVVVGALAQLAGHVPVSGVSTWKGAPDEYKVHGSTSIPARRYTLVYWESFSWFTSGGTTQNTVIRPGLSGIELSILHAAGVDLTSRPAVISGLHGSGSWKP